MKPVIITTIFFYLSPNYLRVYYVVLSYSSVVWYPSCHLRVQETAPSLVSQSQSPQSSISKLEPPHSLSFAGFPPLPWCGQVPSLVSQSQSPSLPLLLCGVVWSCPKSGIAKPEAPSLVSQSQSPSHPLVSHWVYLFFSVAWCGLVPSLVSQSQSPKSGIAKPEPPPPFGLLLGLPLLLRGVVWPDVLLGAHGNNLQGPAQWTGFQHEEEA